MSTDHSPQRFSYAEVFALAAWLSLGLAALELLGLGILKWGFGRFLWLSPYVIWMGPLGHMLMLGLMAGPLALVHRTVPRLCNRFAVVVALTLPSFVSIVLVIPGLYLYAVAVLALGLAWQTARWITPRSPQFFVAMRRWGAIAPATIVGIATLQLAGIWTVQKVSTARLPDLEAPNILFVLLDTVRAQSMSAYGYERATTPFLETLAERGVLFEQPISPSSWTLPSHATAFTGRQLHEHGASWMTPVDPDLPLLAEALRDQGYATGAFVANVLYVGSDTGLDRGFIRFEDYRVSWGEFILSTAVGRTIANHPRVRARLRFFDIIDRKNGEMITRDFLDWQRDTTQPFFAFLNYLDAHEPYTPPAEYETMFGPVGPRDWYSYTHQLRVSFRSGRRVMGQEENQSDLNAYDGGIRYLDDQIRVMLDSLAARGALNNTIVIVTSDHGEHFGENGKYGHADGLDMPAILVPLIMDGPGVPNGARVSTTVGLDHLPATIWDLAGLDAPLALPGHSLADLWRGVAPPAALTAPVRAEFVETNGHPKVTALLDEGYHYLHSVWPDSVTEELYYLVTDPRQERNLTGDPDEGERLKRLRAAVNGTP